MIRKGDTILKTMTLERHNKTIMRLLSQHEEEVQRLKDIIVSLKRKERVVTTK
ncbi:MAG: hypothetical protein ABIH89_00325 [Elusimicrobiota bacterium]